MRLTKKVAFVCSFIMFITAGFSVSGQSVTYYLGSSTGHYDQVLRNTPAGGSTLEYRVGKTDRLPIDSSMPSPYSPASLRIKWKSAVGGSWRADIRLSGWALKNATLFDSLAFVIYSSEGMDIQNLPYLGLMDNSDSKSQPIKLSDYVTNLPAGAWVEVRIPLSDITSNLANASVDFTNVKRIFFQHGETDNIQHAINIDYLRIKRNLIAPSITYIKGFGAHVELRLKPAAITGNQNLVYRSTDGGKTFQFLKKLNVPSSKQYVQKDTIYLDWIGKVSQATGLQYRLVAADGNNSDITSTPSAAKGVSVRPQTDDELMEMVTEGSFNYFWDFSFSNSLMPLSITRRGWNQANTGNTALMILAYIAGAERGYVPRDSVVMRITKACDVFIGIRAAGMPALFSSTFDWRNPNAMPIQSSWNDGGMLAEALICARQYFNRNTPQEVDLRDKCTKVYNDMDWAIHVNPKNDLTEWTYYKDTNDGEFKHDGYTTKVMTELMSGFYVGAGSPTHPIEGRHYRQSWLGKAVKNWSSFSSRQSNYDYGRYFDIMGGGGSALYIFQYLFMAVNPRGLTDGYCNDYAQTARNFALAHVAFAKANPTGSKTMSEESWGTNALTDNKAGYNPGDLSAFRGTIGPYSAIGMMQYTPEESMKALKHYYYDLGDRIFTHCGFVNSFSLDSILPERQNDYKYYNASNNDTITTPEYYVENDIAYSGIMLVALENARTGLFWKLGAQDSVVARSLRACGLRYNNVNPTLKDGLIGWYKMGDTSSMVGTKDNVTGWKDASGKANDLSKVGSGKIALTTNALNGYNAIAFNNKTAGSKTYLKSMLQQKLTGYNLSAYVVTKIKSVTSSNSPLLTIGTGTTLREDTVPGMAYVLYTTSNTPNMGVRRVDPSGIKLERAANKAMASGAFTTTSAHLEAEQQVITVNTAGKASCAIYVQELAYDTLQIDGKQVLRFNEQKTKYNYRPGALNAEELRLGASASAAEKNHLDAEVAEVILFDQNKYGQGFEYIINSYLALKYGLEQSLGTRALYNYYDAFGSTIWDGGLATNHNIGIAGIGRSSELFGLDQRLSVSSNPTQLMVVSTGSYFGEKAAFTKDNSFLIWGQNAKYSVGDFHAVSAQNYNQPLSASKREWRMEVSNLDNAVSIAISVDSIRATLSSLPASGFNEVGVVVAGNKEFADAKFISGRVKSDSLLLDGLRLGDYKVVYMAIAFADSSARIVTPDTVTPPDSTHTDPTSAKTTLWQHMAVYPNPATSYINIRCNSEGFYNQALVYNIYTMTGVGVLAGELEFGSSQGKTIELPKNMRAGVYIISVRTRKGDRVFSKQILKK